MNLSTGSKIRWEPSCGMMIGSVKNITLAPAASGEIIPWIDVEYNQYEKRSNSYVTRSVRLCASNSGLKQLRVELVN